MALVVTMAWLAAVTVACNAIATYQPTSFTK